MPSLIFTEEWATKPIQITMPETEMGIMVGHTQPYTRCCCYRLDASLTFSSGPRP
jgi:hypothetical protein